MAQTGNRPGRATPIGPPSRGQPITAAYLRQEYQVARGVATPNPVGPGIRLFRAPSGGVAGAVLSGGKITSGSALCQPWRWVGDGWAEDPTLPPMRVYNSYPDESVPGAAFVWADWKGDHWDAVAWTC